MAVVEAIVFEIESVAARFELGSLFSSEIELFGSVVHALQAGFRDEPVPAAQIQPEDEFARNEQATVLHHHCFQARTYINRMTNPTTFNVLDVR